MSAGFSGGYLGLPAVRSTGSIQLDRWIAAHPGQVESAHREHDGWGDTPAQRRAPSWWVYLAHPLWCPEGECGTIHEKSITEVLRRLAGIELAPEEVR